MLCLAGKDCTTGTTRRRSLTAPHTCCRQLFGETVEEDFRAPALLGLEYLFCQSTGESGPFSLEGIADDGPGPEEEVVPPVSS
ncbi:hypothetical protein NHX12_024994 [Muraenolepis orangiensis]|uniref:Uncharacterized protein n=1 Tax=Muraenolepis orangiensis TaxID=630683 RepID=A0A9Q0EKH2_9TELE|nr:hypothetical protein NHX12_024994 [Muraenolepis orangiensis]